MRYTCDLLDKACVDRMNTYQVIGLFIMAIIVGVVVVYEKLKKKKVTNTQINYTECCDNCDLAYPDTERRNCYLRCARRALQ